MKSTLIVTSFALALSGTPHALGQWKPSAEVLVKPGDQRSYVGVDGVLPITQTGHSLLFADLKARLAEQDAHEFNVGLGYRSFTESQQWVLGSYAAFDRRRTPSGADFSQITLGAEALSADWDFRVNYYHPTKNKQLVGLGATRFRGFGVFRNGVFEEAMRGADFEVGRHLPFSEKIETRAFLAAYTFKAADLGTHADGARLRVEVRPRQDVVLGLSVQHDNLFKTAWFAEVRYAFGKEPRQGARKLIERMTEPWTRDIDVQVTPQTESAKIGFAQQQPGMAVHVDSSKAAGGDGSYEQPYHLVATCEAAKCSDPKFNYIRLWRGSSEARPYTPVTLISGKTLWGEGVDIYTNVVSPGLHPVIVNPAGNAIALANGGIDFMVAGVNARNTGGAGIRGNNLGGTITIRDNLIEPTEGSGIVLSDTTSTGNRSKTITIANNSIKGTRVIGDGLYVSNYASGAGASRQQTVMLTGNTIHVAHDTVFGYINAAVRIANTADAGATATQNVALSGNTMSAVRAEGGVAVVNTASDRGTAVQNLAFSANRVTIPRNVGGDYGIAVSNFGITSGAATQNITLTGNTINVAGFAGGEFNDSIFAALNFASQSGTARQNVTLDGNTFDANFKMRGVALTNLAGSIEGGGPIGGGGLGGSGLDGMGLPAGGGTAIQHATLTGNTIDARATQTNGVFALFYAEGGGIGHQNLTVTGNTIPTPGNGANGLTLIAGAEGSRVTQSATVTNTTISAKGAAVNLTSIAKDNASVAQRATIAGSTLTPLAPETTDIIMRTEHSGGGSLVQSVVLQNTPLAASTPIDNTGSGTCAGGGVEGCP